MSMVAFATAASTFIGAAAHGLPAVMGGGLLIVGIAIGLAADRMRKQRLAAGR